MALLGRFPFSRVTLLSSSEIPVSFFFPEVRRSYLGVVFELRIKKK